MHLLFGTARDRTWDFSIPSRTRTFYHCSTATAKINNWTVWLTSDSRWWTVSFERRDRAWNSLSSYFVSGSTRSFTSRRLLMFSKIQEISCNYLHEPPFCKFCESKVQRLIAQNRQFRFKLEFKAERVYFKRSGYCYDESNMQSG